MPCSENKRLGSHMCYYRPTSESPQVTPQCSAPPVSSPFSPKGWDTWSWGKCQVRGCTHSCMPQKSKYPGNSGFDVHSPTKSPTSVTESLELCQHHRKEQGPDRIPLLYGPTLDSLQAHLPVQKQSSSCLLKQ